MCRNFVLSFKLKKGYATKDFEIKTKSWLFYQLAGSLANRTFCHFLTRFLPELTQRQKLISNHQSICDVIVTRHTTRYCYVIESTTHPFWNLHAPILFPSENLSYFLILFILLCRDFIDILELNLANIRVQKQSTCLDLNCNISTLLLLSKSVCIVKNYLKTNSFFQRSIIEKLYT